MTVLHDSTEATTDQNPRKEATSGCSAYGGVHDKDSSRRQFLQTAMAGTVTGFATAAYMKFANPRPVLAQSKLSPDAALQELMDGNRRFVSGRLAAHEQDLAILKQNTIEKQEPFAALLSCADSRVPVELVFDQSIGHLFVTRSPAMSSHPRSSRVSSMGRPC
jgi:carbonic anhydrase